MGKLWLLVLLVGTFAGSGFAQRSEPPNPAQLLKGKLMFVGEMPNGVDAWVVEDLRLWGKYRPTRIIEGADLAMKAYKPSRRTEYRLKHGIPTPKQPQPKKGGKPILFSVVVTDWVTGQTLWTAELLDRKPRRREGRVVHRHEVQINARGLSTEQMATAIVRALRSYVDQLAGAQGSAPTPLSHRDSYPY